MRIEPGTFLAISAASITRVSRVSPLATIHADSSSGHGGQTKDTDGDEDDGFDEVIYPVDYKQAGHIVDDECEFGRIRRATTADEQCELRTRFVRGC